MNKKFNVRLYKPGDEEKIVELLRLSFIEWNNRKEPVEYWKWRYLDTPIKSTVIVAEYNDRIIGTSHDMKINIKIGDSTLLCAYGGDVATHPEYRGMGVYSKITDYLESLRVSDNVKWVYAYSSNPIVHKDWIKRKRTPFPHLMSNMYRIKDPYLHLNFKSIKNAFIKSIVFSTLRVMNNIENLFNSAPEPTSNFRIVEIDDFDDRVNIFWDKIKEDYNFILVLNKNYLNWRYRDPRSGNYKVKLAIENNEILGLIITEVKETNGYIEGYIDDLIALPQRIDVAYALLRDVCTYFDNLKINTLHYYTIKGHPYRKISIKNGFIDTSRVGEVHISCELVDVDNEFEILRSSSPAKIYLSHGDYF